MLSSHELLQNISMELLHGAEVEEAIPCVVNMSCCKEVWHHLLHSIQMQRPVTLSFCSSERHHNEDRINEALNPESCCVALAAFLYEQMGKL